MTRVPDISLIRKQMKEDPESEFCLAWKPLIEEIDKILTWIDYARLRLHMIACDRLESGRNLGPINSYAAQNIAREILRGP